MKVKVTHAYQADLESSKIFFDTVLRFFDLKNADALDAFARNGELTVQHYAPHVKSVSCWELDGQHQKALEGIPNVNDILIGCSYRIAKFEEEVGGKTFDLVVVDSPQGFHHADNGENKCEHFDFLLNHVPKLIKDESVIILYVNKRPYDKGIQGSHGYDEYDEYDYKQWMAMRSAFYGSSVITEEQAMKVYRDLLYNFKIDVVQQLLVPCFSDCPGYEDYAFRLAIKVRKL